MEKIQCSEADATKLAEWIANRGGISVWESVNLSNPGKSWFGPARDTDGQPSKKPTWQAANQPVRTVLSSDLVEVLTAKEVNRFHVAVRRGDGLSFRLTDGSSRRVNRALVKAGEEAWYEFDYFSQECVIYVPDTKVTLTEWLEQKNAEQHTTQTANT